MTTTTHGLADSASYEQRTTRKREIDTALGVRAHLRNAIGATVDEPTNEERPATVPVLTQAEKEENYRRLAAPVTFNEWVGADGITYRQYFDPKLPAGESDGRLDTLRVDRGKGTTESLSMLAKEGSVKVRGLLAQPNRDRSGRFVTSKGA